MGRKERGGWVGRRGGVGRRERRGGWVGGRGEGR